MSRNHAKEAAWAKQKYMSFGMKIDRELGETLNKVLAEQKITQASWFRTVVVETVNKFLNNKYIPKIKLLQDVYESNNNILLREVDKKIHLLQDVNETSKQLLQEVIELREITKNQVITINNSDKSEILQEVKFDVSAPVVNLLQEDIISNDKIIHQEVDRNNNILQEVNVKCIRCGALNDSYKDGYFRCIDCDFGNYEPTKDEADEQMAKMELGDVEPVTKPPITNETPETVEETSSKTPITPEMVAKWAELNANGESCAKIGKNYGYNETTISRKVKKFREQQERVDTATADTQDTEKPKRKLTPKATAEEVARWDEMVRQGMTWKQIAEPLGRDYNGIRKAVLKRRAQMTP